MALRKPRPAFSLISLLVVLGIIALLIGFLLPIVQRIRQAAARTHSVNNEKQLALACHNFHDSFKKFPFNGIKGQFGDPAKPGSGSWAYQILPFVEQEPAFKRPKEVREGVVFVVMTCPPRDRRPTSKGEFHGPFTDYALNTWLNEPKNGGIAAPDRPTRFGNIPDGLSNTILLGELAIKPADYHAEDAGEGRESFLFGGLAGSGRNNSKHVPDGPASEPNRFGSPFAGGTNFALGDGSVRFIAFDALRGDITLLLRPDDGMAVPDF